MWVFILRWFVLWSGLFCFGRLKDLLMKFVLFFLRMLMFMLIVDIFGNSGLILSFSSLLIVRWRLSIWSLLRGCLFRCVLRVVFFLVLNRSLVVFIWIICKIVEVRKLWRIFLMLIDRCLGMLMWYLWMKVSC